MALLSMILMYGLLIIYGKCDHLVDPKLLDIPEIHRLETLISSTYLLKHNFLKCFEMGDFANMTEAASIFALNHYVYSKNFINYLETVASKIDNPDISKPILENINEELGNYEQDDIDTLSKIGIKQDWYDKIPHKFLSQRFFESVGIEKNNIPDINMKDEEELNEDDGDDDEDDEDSPGVIFTKYMINLYKNSNACESLGIIGFAIEETVSRLYQYIWNGLKNHTLLTDEEMVFFPLHILIDDGHADLLKLGFKYYLLNNKSMCDNVEFIIKDVLDKRVKMYDDIRNQIELKQNYQCKLPKEINCEANENNFDVDTDVVDVDDAVKDAQKQTLKYDVLNDPSWTIIDKMTLSARILANQGHGETLSGQITCIDDDDDDDHNITMFVNAYGKPLELVTNNDFLLIDGDLNVIKGKGFANKATRFHFHVYRKRPDIKCIIHTHPPYSSALSITGHKLFISHMDIMAFYDDVQYLSSWPGIPFGDEEGNIISNILSDKYWSALLSHHGLIVGGKSIQEATYRAYFFERAAKMQINALSAVGGDINKLKKTNPKLSIKAKNWRISKGPVNAHFNGWAQIILKNQILF